MLGNLTVTQLQCLFLLLSVVLLPGMLRNKPAGICLLPRNKRKPIREQFRRIIARMQAVIEITDLTKTYAGGFEALKNVSLSINRGEIFALLGPNGAGKTTLINIVCGIVNKTAGTVLVDGHDIVGDFRLARAKIGLVPQELPAESFETVWNTCHFSRGLFGKPAIPSTSKKC